MKNVIMKLRPQTAVKIIYAFYISSVVTHILVLATIIPYTWINGGRSASYAAQANQSVVSIALLGVFGALVWAILRTGEARKKWQTRVLFALGLLWTLGFLMQLIGTPFERFVLSVIIGAGAIMHFRLAASFKSKV